LIKYTGPVWQSQPGRAVYTESLGMRGEMTVRVRLLAGRNKFGGEYGDFLY